MRILSARQFIPRPREAGRTRCTVAYHHTCESKGNLFAVHRLLFRRKQSASRESSKPVVIFEKIEQGANKGKTSSSSLFVCWLARVRGEARTRDEQRKWRRFRNWRISFLLGAPTLTSLLCRRRLSSTSAKRRSWKHNVIRENFSSRCQQRLPPLGFS